MEQLFFIRKAVWNAFSAGASEICVSAWRIWASSSVFVLFQIFVAAVFLGQTLAVSANASKALPFTREDRAIIVRNETLSALMKKNPQAVRQILDMIAVARVKQNAAGRAVSDSFTPLTGGSAPSPAKENIAIDAKKNPDLELLLGSSPEATHDLFQLLKQASEKKQLHPAPK